MAHTVTLVACNIAGMVELIAFDQPRYNQPADYFKATRKGLSDDLDQRFDNLPEALEYAGIEEGDMVVIDDETAHKLANLYIEARAGYTSSWTTSKEKVQCVYSDGRPMMDHGRPMMRGLYFHEVNETLKGLVPFLPANWKRAVDEIIMAHRNAETKAALARAEARRIESYEAVEHPAIRAYLLAFAKAPGRRDAKPADLSGLCNLAKSAEKRGKPAYQPQGGCKAKLHLKEAILFEYRQESYADHSVYAIPITVEEGADLNICRGNLYNFCRSLSTHNGLAGSGTTHEARIETREEGMFVVLDMRHSISD